MDRKNCTIFASLFSLFVLMLLAQNVGADQPKTVTPTRHNHNDGKPTPLSPRAQPYALAVGSGTVNVRFSVRMIGKKQAGTVKLRQSGAQESIAMNDQGVNGDSIAKDNIHGVSIPIDTSKLALDTCLSYEAFINDGGAKVRSEPLQLCVSSLPVRMAASNKTHPVVFSDGTVAVADEILITANPNTSAAAIRQLAASINATVVGSIPPLNLYQLKLTAPATTANLSALIAQLRTRPEVKSASINAIGHSSYAPSDPEYSSQHGLQLIRAQDVWDVNATGNGITVIVLDSGLDRSHPDFGIPGDCQLAENDCDGSNADTLGHGTQVGGIIAAKTNNALGVAGVAYGSKIHSIQVSADAAITEAEMVQGFTDAASYLSTHGSASVINASFGVLNAFGAWAPVCSAINSAVLNAGIPVAVVVNGAGNNNTNGSFYPARCNDSTSPEHAGLTRKDLLITVANSASVVHADCGAVAVDQRCSTSNYGAWVEITAPGSVIRTTAVGGGYTSQSGTSFSTPMVTGAAAILNSCGVPLDQIESTLRNSANVIVPFPDGSSAPRLDIYRALRSRNVSPTAVNLSNNRLDENTDTSAGAEVGILTATDLDTCDKHTYSIVGGADAAKFSIGGVASDRLRLTDGVLHFASKPGYTVIVRTTDFFGATFDQTLNVTVGIPPAPPSNLHVVVQ